MPDFQGTSFIILQPHDRSVPYRFTLTECSDPKSNDGSIPYGASIDSLVVTVTKLRSTVDVTEHLISGTAFNGNEITLALTYPTALGDGIYCATFVVTFNSGITMEFKFNRIKAQTR